MVVMRTDLVRSGRAGREPRGLSLQPRRLAFGLAALAVVLVSGGDGYGYRFTSARDLWPLAVSDDALRWDPSVWGPRDTLRWVIADDPGWTSSWESTTRDGETQSEDPPFRRAADAIPFVEEALAAWTAIGSADIRWEVVGVADGPGYVLDDRFMVTALTEEDFPLGPTTAALSRTWRVRRGAEWRIAECDVVMRSSSSAVLGSDDPANLATLIHELGHCIGLDHAAAHSIWEGVHGTVSVWGETPKMSYGIEVTNDLTLDDIAGASLLRPAGSWPRNVGSIAGRVTVGGEAARYVAVLAARLAGSDLAPGESVFTDEQGRFLIEGLAPGDYLIWAGPMIRLDAHSELLARGATLDARDVFSLDPLSVPVNRAPHATVVIPSVTLTAGDAATLNLASYFSDQNNGPLTFTAVSSNADTVSVSVSGSALTLNPRQEGNTTVTATEPPGPGSVIPAGWPPPGR